MNIPENGYYITVFSKDGEKIKDIGLIEGMEDYRPMIKQKFSEGFVFKIDKQYYIFLEKLFAVKVFDEMGNMTQEVKLEVVNNEFKELKEQLFTPPDSPNHPPNGVKSARYMQEVIYRNGNFYILTFDVFAEREKTFPIFVLGKDFKFLNKIVLELKEPTKIGLESTGFEVLNDENRILYPIKNEAKVYEFRK